MSDAEPKKNKADVLSDHPFRHLIFGPIANEVTFKKYLLLT
jgi:hypothetical protein